MEDKYGHKKTKTPVFIYLCCSPMKPEFMSLQNKRLKECGKGEHILHGYMKLHASLTSLLPSTR